MPNADMIAEMTVQEALSRKSNLDIYARMSLKTKSWKGGYG